MSEPNPGSDEARAAGCKCPVIDNCRGRGFMGLPSVFVMALDCPLHGTTGAELSAPSEPGDDRES